MVFGNPEREVETFMRAMHGRVQPSLVTTKCRDCGGDGHRECAPCHGSGEAKCDCEGDNECIECDGTGETDCPHCDGDGRNWAPCLSCHGSGTVVEEVEPVMHSADLWTLRALARIPVGVGRK